MYPTVSETGLPTGAVRKSSHNKQCIKSIMSPMFCVSQKLLPSSSVLTVSGIVYGPNPTLVRAATEHK